MSIPLHGMIRKCFTFKQSDKILEFKKLRKYNYIFRRCVWFRES